MPSAVHHPSVAREATARPASGSDHWRVNLLNGVEARAGDHVVDRFSNRAVALLLARLALWPERRHAREELIELLWPGVSPTVGRNRFRPVLSALRAVLASHPAASPPPWLEADRTTVRLRPGATSCDVVELQRRLGLGDQRAGRALREGVLLPGHYDDWVVEERARLQRLAPKETASAHRPVVRAALLPPRLGSLFGRAGDIDALMAALRRHRVVTLRGGPGVGKSRLAEDCAHRRAPHESVVFVDLVGCPHATQIPRHLRAALGLGPDDDEAAIVERIGSGPALCIVDHAEHLLADGAEPAFRHLLGLLPAMRLLVASRRALRWPGAGEHVLAPMPLPAVDCPPSQASDHPAIAMFMERVRCVQRGLWLHAGTLPDVIAICRAARGLPLAIALAAAGARTRTLGELRAAFASADSFDAALDLPIDVRSDIPRGHHSLSAAVERSWRLLDAGQRRFLTALAGAPDATDPPTIGRATGCPATLLHGCLSALVGESLLDVHEAPDGRLRFSVPDCVREHARHALRSSQSATPQALWLSGSQRAA